MSQVYHAKQLSLFTPDDTPLKQCTQCPNAYPATLEYFHPHKSYPDGLNAACRECRKRISRESAVRRRAGKWAEPKQKKQPSLVTLICSACSKRFQRKIHGYNADVRRGRDLFFCSRACKDEQHLTPLPSSIKEQYLEGATMLDIAKQYNTTETVIWRRLKSIGVPTRSIAFSNTLRDSPMKGKTHTEDARQKISEAAICKFSDPAQLEAMRQRTIKQLSEGRMKTSSSLEDYVAIELSRQGFAFIRQHPVACKGHRGYIGCVDFLLLDGRVIEVNGTYWHCDPRKYPDGPKNETQKGAKERYEKKIARLDELGIPLIELWEIDLRADMAGTIARALAIN